MRLRPILFGLVATLLLLCMLVPIVLIANWLPLAKHVTLSGVVVDESTGKPISKARVVVLLNANGFPYDAIVAKYGLTTNERGQFDVDLKSDHRFSDVFVTACAPDDSSGWSNVEPVAKNIVVITKRDLQCNYDDFDGGGTPRQRVQFINECWPVPGVLERPAIR